MLRLPHPGMASLIDAVKHRVATTRRSMVAATEITYLVFLPGSDTPDLAFYDEDGRIYIPEHIVALDARYADLLAFHEHIEVRHKRVGRSHAYAHRQALIGELLAAKQILTESVEWQGYVRWRIGLYPSWKVPEPEQVSDQFVHLLNEDRPLKGALLQLVKEYRL